MTSSPPSQVDQEATKEEAPRDFSIFKECEKHLKKRKKKTRTCTFVTISVGLMQMTHDGLKPERGMTVLLAVKPESGASDVLKAALKKFQGFYKVLLNSPYFLLYPNGTKVVNLPGTDTPFSVKDYKEASGKSYRRMTVYICLAQDFMACCSNQLHDESDKGNSLLPEEDTTKETCTEDSPERKKSLADNVLTLEGAESKNVSGDLSVTGHPCNPHDDINRAATRKPSDGAEPLSGFHKLMRLGTPETEDVRSADVQSEDTTAAQDVACQTDLSVNDIVDMEEELKRLTSELHELRSKALDTDINKESFERSYEKTKFYTGLPNFVVLMQVLSLCEPFMSALSSLDRFKQLMLVLMRLRLNLPLKDLAHRFEISESTACRIFRKVLSVLHKRLQFFIKWPDRDSLRATTPLEFRQAFGSKVAIIIDCLEVFTERPLNLLERTQTWLNYKHHNKVKCLLGITLQGHVLFISKAWGSCVSDEKITEDCGFLDHLLPGDIVLANHGFASTDSVGLHCAVLKIPAFINGKFNLSPCKVEETASIRIRVERVTGLVQRQYQILQSRAMMREHMGAEGDNVAALIDKMGVICCALTNLSESVVPSELNITKVNTA